MREYKIRYVLFGLGMVMLLSSCYKMRVEVHHLPSNTPDNAEIFITGEFNNWDPGDSKYILRVRNDSVYYIDLPRGVGGLNYKFTRGDWTTVEKDNCGYEIEDRYLVYGSNKNMVVDNIRSWADLSPVDCDQISIVLSSLPDNTPTDAVFVLAGNINNWDTSEEGFVFQADASFDMPVLTVLRPDNLEELEFKITRGSLTRAEADALGREIRPRTIVFGEADTIFIEVKSWQDLENEKGNMITLIIDNIPENTPAGDPIFFVGEINDWYPHDEGLRLERNSSGQYFINLPKRAFNTEYKFTRGNWKTVETDEFGEDIDNRRLRREKSSEIVHVRIKGWHDLD